MSDRSDRRTTRVHLELRLDPPVAEKLQRLAAAEQRTVSVVAQRLLVTGMNVEEKGEAQT